MGAPQSADKDRPIFDVPTILLAIFFLLPGLIPKLFGWLSGFLATPVFVILTLNGARTGAIKLRNGVLVALALSVIFKLLPETLFSLSLIPLGFSFYRSVEANDDEILTAQKGIIVLGISWLVYWTAYGTILEINPYTELLRILDTGFAQTYEVYRNSADVPIESLVYIERVVTEVRKIIPVILPGILVCTVLFTVWINMLVSLSVMGRLAPGKLPWKKYREWRLPDKAVWIPIIAGFSWVLGKGIISSFGISLILISILLYLFQGLAVLVYFLDKWKLPLYLKILIYGILVFQSYGFLMLSIAGIADVWLDFRRERNEDNQTDN